MIKNGASHGDPSAHLSNADYPKRGQRRLHGEKEEERRQKGSSTEGRRLTRGRKVNGDQGCNQLRGDIGRRHGKFLLRGNAGGVLLSARIGIPYCGSRCTSFRSRGRKYQRLARLQATDLLAANIGEPKNKESPRSGEGNARWFLEKIRRGLEGFWFLLFSLSLLSLSRLETGSRRLFVDS